MNFPPSLSSDAHFLPVLHSQCQHWSFFFFFLNSHTCPCRWGPGGGQSTQINQIIRQSHQHTPHEPAHGWSPRASAASSAVWAGRHKDEWKNEKRRRAHMQKNKQTLTSTHTHSPAERMDCHVKWCRQGLLGCVCVCELLCVLRSHTWPTGWRSATRTYTLEFTHKCTWILYVYVPYAVGTFPHCTLIIESEVWLNDVMSAVFLYKHF